MAHPAWVRAAGVPVATGLYSPRLHVVLYSFLLVATPFILLRRFLVETIGHISGYAIEWGGRAVPVVPVAAGVVLLAVLVVVRRHITPLRVAGGVLALGLIALGQQVTDLYFGHNFYDLQQNWHYIAYGLFAFMLYRDLAPRGWTTAAMMLGTYFSALAFSTFDEAFQGLLSSRVFDISDIGKDAWGTLIGIAALYLWTTPANALPGQWRRIRHTHLRDYFRTPASVLALLFLLGFIFLGVGSLLTDSRYAGAAVLITLGLFAAAFLMLHVSQFRAGQVALVTVAVLVGGGLGWSAWTQRGSLMAWHGAGRLLYAGIPLPYFDVLVYPDGRFRFVDKKEYFNERDQRFFLRHAPDILLIGSGPDGCGGRGFPDHGPHQFVWNRFTQRGTQVIILPSAAACERYNALRSAGKHVLFVLHSTR